MTYFDQSLPIGQVSFKVTCLARKSTCLLAMQYIKNFPYQSTYAYKRVAEENSWHFAMPPLRFPRKTRKRNSTEFPWWCLSYHYPNTGSVSYYYWLKQISLAAQPIRSTSHIRVKWHVTIGKFLFSFLRHHLYGKPVAVLQNVRCFLKKIKGQSLWGGGPGVVL